MKTFIFDILTNENIGQVKNHQLKLVALRYSGFACPPLPDISIHQSYWWY